jgi:hypothetical protein
MADYPTTLPIAQVMEVVSVLRSGQTKEKLPTLAHDLWEIQGYGQGIIFGSPAASVVTDSGSPSFDLVTQAVPDTDVLAKLEKVVAAHNSGGAQSLVDWGPIVLWIAQQLIEILKAKLSK